MSKKYNNGDKPHILLMSDDLRMHSGVATVSKEVVMGTLDTFEWAQIGGAINHPDQGKVVDMRQAVQKETGIEDAYLQVYPTTGYGNPDMLREIIQMEKPDAILHFTDPRFWTWLYQMENEIRQNIPIFYYNIWDDIPDPHYNKNYYRSCDLLMGISKQTYGINTRVLADYDYKDWQIKYVPHGINSKRFFPIQSKIDKDMADFKIKFGLDKYKYRILYLNRNIRRKQPGDIVLAYKHFMDGLTPEQREECVMVFHTAPSDDNGTDIRAVCKAMLPEDYNVIFTHDKAGPMNDKEMNFLYNSIEVYINIASNEGFGLGSCEAMSVKKPIIVNVTGGLQDQCGFKNEKGKFLTADDYIELKSNHRGTYKEHGEWVYPVFPSNISLQGSPMTPYIFDDRCQYEDAGEGLKHFYDMGSEERERCGELGYEFVKSKDSGMDSVDMCDRFKEYMTDAIDKFEKKERYMMMEVV